MKLLFIKATNFKNLKEETKINFIAQSKKTSVDKEYELQFIADGLYTFNNIAFVGKNASGKTTALDLLDCCYSILSNFYLENKNYSFENIHLEIYFYEENNIYKYITDLSNKNMSSKAVFSNQELYVKPYYKSYLSTILDMEGFTKLTFEANLPNTTSILFFLLKESNLTTYHNANGFGKDTYKELFNLINQNVISNELLSKIIHLFDDNITNLIKIDDINYKLVLKDKELVLSSSDLYNYLSSGTTKGILLYADIISSLKNGNDIIIDEIENHFHKTLVENIINLYKDKSVNKHNATLYFSTHYPELLDLFNRRDNIYICRQENKIILENLYQTYPIRNELSKSRQFYNNAFKTEVNYDDLIEIKKELL